MQVCITLIITCGVGAGEFPPLPSKFLILIGMHKQILSLISFIYQYTEIFWNA